MSDEIIDLKEVLERVENDHDLLIELIKIFLDDYPGKLESLKKAVEEKNIEEIKNIAHSVKGASANISAKSISAIFLDVENLARNNNIEKVNQHYGRLDSLLNDLKDYLNKLKEDRA